MQVSRINSYNSSPQKTNSQPTGNAWVRSDVQFRGAFWAPRANLSLVVYKLFPHLKPEVIDFASLVANRLPNVKIKNLDEYFALKEANGGNLLENLMLAPGRGENSRLLERSKQGIFIKESYFNRFGEIFMFRAFNPRKPKIMVQQVGFLDSTRVSLIKNYHPKSGKLVEKIRMDRSGTRVELLEKFDGKSGIKTLSMKKLTDIPLKYEVVHYDRISGNEINKFTLDINVKNA